MTRKTTAKITLATGIYQDAYGIDVIARVGKGGKLTDRKRFDLTNGAGVRYDASSRALAELRTIQLAMLTDLRESTSAARTVGGTLAADIDKFLPTITRPGIKTDFSYLLPHWANCELGALPRKQITRKQIVAQLEDWHANGEIKKDGKRHPVSNVTLNHRIRAIRAVYEHFRQDDDEVLPTDKIKRFTPPRNEPRGVPLEIIDRIVKNLSDRGRATKGEKRPAFSETKIRIRVMAWTGLPHSQLMRLRRKDVNFHESRVRIPERRKGKGAPPVLVALIPPALEALQEYDAAGLWGKKFSRSSMWKSWRRAIERTLRELGAAGDKVLLEQFLTAVPDNCRPYDLRHSFLTDAYVRSGGDIRAVSALAQHGQLETTKRYTEAGVPERVANAIAKMSAAWAHLAPPAPDTTPTFGRPRLRKKTSGGPATVRTFPPRPSAP